MAVDEVLGGAAQDDLARDADGGVLLKTNGRLLLVAVVENDGDAGLCDACLAALVDEVLFERQLLDCCRSAQSVMYLLPFTYLQVLRANCRHVGDTQNKANGIQNVGLATAV